MLRALRKVLQNRSGGNSFRLGQIQAAETKDGPNSRSQSEERKRKENINDNSTLNAPATLLDTTKHGKDEISMELGFRLLGSIFHHTKDKNGFLSPPRYIGNGEEYGRGTAKTFIGELASWCYGVMALSGILVCRHFVTDDHSPLHIKAKDIPKIFSRVVLGKVPSSTLAVLPGDQEHRGTASPTDGLDEAIASFQSTFSECTAAAQNKLAIKFTALKQYQKAFLLFEQASERGHPVAQFNLGLCYEHGKGVKADLIRAAQCYEKASQRGHAGAMYSLARFCMEGGGGVPMDKAKGLGLLSRAAELGVSKAQCYLGLYYAQTSCSEQDYAKACVLLEQAAAKKDPTAEYHLGVFYEQGLGFERDLVKAGQLYKLAAKHGHVSAQYNLGVFHEQGLGGFPVNKTEAARYYRMAAEAGDADAKHNLQLLWQQSALPTAENFVALQRSQERNNLLKKIFSSVTLAENQQVPSCLPRCASSPGILDEFSINNSADRQLSSHREASSGPVVAF